MTDQFADLIKIAGITLLVTFLWAATLALTYWDTYRQGLGFSKSLPWLLVVALLPFLGFVIYLLIRWLKLLFSGAGTGMEPIVKRRTALKNPLVRQGPSSTLLASDLDKETMLSLKSAARYIFVVTAGADLGKEFEVRELPARIGRGPEVTIRLDGDLGVSREHAEVYERSGVLRIRDLKSTHGTQVNGIDINDHGLNSGNRIRVGLTELALKIVKE